MTQEVPYRSGPTSESNSQDPISPSREQIDKNDYHVAVVCQSDREQKMFVHMLDQRYRKQTFHRTKPDSSYVSESGMSGGHHVIIVMRREWEESSIDSLIHEVCEDFPSISLLLVLIHGVPIQASVVRPGDAVVVRGDGEKWSDDLPVKLDGMKENIAIGLQRLSRDLPSTEIKANVHHGFIFDFKYCDQEYKQLCFNDRQSPREAFGPCLVISGIGENQSSDDGPLSAVACAITIISKLRVQDTHLFKPGGFSQLNCFGTVLNQVGSAGEQGRRRVAFFDNAGTGNFFSPALVASSNLNFLKSATGDTHFNNYGEVGHQVGWQIVNGDFSMW